MPLSEPFISRRLGGLRLGGKLQPGRAAKVLQRAVGAYEDGAVGPETLMAVTASQTHEIINRIAVHRDIYYRELKHFDTFGRGWIRRKDETREQAIEMGRG